MTPNAALSFERPLRSAARRLQRNVRPRPCRAASSWLIRVGDLVVDDVRIVARHHSLDGRWDNGDVGTFACKGLDRVQGVPDGHDVELCTRVNVSPENRPADEAG